MYIVIEKFDRLYPIILVDMDTDMPLVFDTPEEAQAEADECQDAIIVNLES